MARQILWKKLFMLLAILFQGLKAGKFGHRFFQALFVSIWIPRKITQRGLSSPHLSHAH